MQIQLRQDLQRFLDHQIESGQYANADDLMNAALQSLKDETELTPDDISELRREISIGIEQLNRGQGAPWDAEQIKQRVRQIHSGKDR